MTKVTKLALNVGLEMVAISSGTFMMGSPDAEVDRYDNEGPQHQVTVADFLMGKYPVTQAQWRAVASLPQVERELNPDPSYFKGDSRPVERVNWHEAMEFCARLSAHSQRPYTLPSEAQWEYACRAGTTSPFRFGETLTTDLANYDGNYTYGSGPQGTYRSETTDVGSFSPNAFGLYDLHGNVLEWCLDLYHENYEGAPTDGSAWVAGGDSRFRVLRGGSWAYTPSDCRCAFRAADRPDYRNIYDGFRVVSVPPRTFG